MIYIIEDDTDIREMESYALRNSGFDILALSDGSGLAEALTRETPDLILLDIMLPGEDGLSILRRLRASERTKRIPIIMVTAKTTEIDKVRGLDMGADDYITKPFGIMELVSRVKALLRRAAPEENDGIIACGTIVMNDSKRRVQAGETVVELTYKEYELLRHMLINRGVVLTREKLLGAVWGYDYIGETRTVDMHIKTLRQKLGDSGAQIVTVRNVGYKLDG
ncbi:MAG: response regulator transcription factor [Clostridiales bacterium]|nr:response regulator transcription factor [Clostridiales bacterium]MDD7550801.1 response regulator transcription factor [Clostridia bacterium]MDY5754496.1 response regulator transcription factor [Eubacteriales bacterium]